MTCKLYIRPLLDIRWYIQENIWLAFEIVSKIPIWF